MRRMALTRATRRDSLHPQWKDDSNGTERNVPRTPGARSSHADLPRRDLRFDCAAARIGDQLLLLRGRDGDADLAIHHKSQTTRLGQFSLDLRARLRCDHRQLFRVVDRAFGRGDTDNAGEDGDREEIWNFHWMTPWVDRLVHRAAAVVATTAAMTSVTGC